jgi:hypothetical protein
VGRRWKAGGRKVWRKAGGRQDGKRREEKGGRGSDRWIRRRDADGKRVQERLKEGASGKEESIEGEEAVGREME